MTHINGISVADQANAPFGGEKTLDLGVLMDAGFLRNSPVLTG